MQNVSDILSVINDHGFDDTDTNTKLAFLNDAIMDFTEREPWPFLEQTATLSFDGTNSTPTNVPSNFESVMTIVDPTIGRLILPERADTLEKEAAELVSRYDEALFYYFIAGQLNFAPIPPSSWTARMRYLAFQPDIDESSTSANILLPTRYWMVFVFGALTRLYDMDDDPEMSVRFEQHFETRIQQIRDSLWKRQYDQPDRVAITDPDYLIDFPI